MRVSTRELKKATRQLLGHLEKLKQKEFEIDQDFYWEISESEIYDVYTEPKDLMIGQLSHDWERIQRILDGTDEPVGQGLVWLSAILRFVGEKSLG
jgi:hypothetical protein